MSKKLARLISDATGASLFEPLDFVRGQIERYAMRISHEPPRMRKSARDCLAIARQHWEDGVPVSIPTFGRPNDLRVTHTAFFECSDGGKRPRISASQQRDERRRKYARSQNK